MRVQLTNRDREGMTALMLAARSSSVAVLGELLMEVYNTEVQLSRITRACSHHGDCRLLCAMCSAIQAAVSLSGKRILFVSEMHCCQSRLSIVSCIFSVLPSVHTLPSFLSPTLVLRYPSRPFSVSLLPLFPTGAGGPRTTRPQTHDVVDARCQQRTCTSIPGGSAGYAQSFRRR